MATSSHESGCVIWLTGLSGAGKTTIATALSASLDSSRIKCAVLDGDELREGLNSNLAFSPEDRLENVRRVAHVAKLVRQHVEVVIVAVISPTRAARELAKDIIGPGFFEVFVDAPVSVCESRDPKGLYRRARAGNIHRFTGVSDPYEPPASPALRLRTDRLSVKEGTKELLKLINGRSNPIRARRNSRYRIDLQTAFKPAESITQAIFSIQGAIRFDSLQ